MMRSFVAIANRNVEVLVRLVSGIAGGRIAVPSMVHVKACSLRLVLLGKLEREVDQFRFPPVNDPQIHSGSDLPDFVPNPMSQQRSLRVIQRDAFLAVE